MDQAVALVEAYLRLNGYFSVTEFPVLEAVQYGGVRTATDLDILAFRFPDAGRLVPPRGGDSGSRWIFAPDPELGCAGNDADMLIGEVKEGRAELNQAAANPAVLRAALARFGCCHPEHLPGVIQALLRNGNARTQCGHRVRLVAFGSLPGSPGGPRYKFISLGHVEQFLRDYIREHWEVVRHAQFKDPAFGFLVMLEKAEHLNGSEPAKSQADISNSRLEGRNHKEAQ